MSADVIWRMDPEMETWASGGLILTPPGSAPGIPRYRNTSPIIGVKMHRRLDRPKSVPAKLRSPDIDLKSQSAERPKTTAGGVRTDCGRVHQLEQEPTRKHNLEAHLPVKRGKPQPWQKTLDSTPVPVMVTPGYVLSKSRNKVEMHIKTDQFFQQQLEERPSSRPDPERDALIAQLQQQIDDLTLFLEEERLNHKDTKRRAAEDLRDRTEELNNQHSHHVQQLEEEFAEQLRDVRSKNNEEMREQQEASEKTCKKMRTEIEFLQGAFESYKSQLHLEMDDRWKKKEEDLLIKHKEETQNKIHKLKAQLIADKNSEKAELGKDHQKEVQQLRRDHKKELDGLLRRFSNAAADLKKLKETEKSLEEREKELAELRADYDSVCRQLTDMTTDLTDTKVKLIGYEQHFQEQVQLIDDKYRQQIHDLMTHNTELRQLYMKKCGQHYDEKTELENARAEQLETAKDAMKVLIESRNRAIVSLAAADTSLEEHPRQTKVRPTSAPVTHQEGSRARLSAGETDEYVYQQRDRSRPSTGRPRILKMIEQEREDGLLEGKSKERQRVEEYIREAL